MSLVLKFVDTPSLEECFVHLQSERKKIRFCESQDIERLCVSLCATHHSGASYQEASCHLF